MSRWLTRTGRAGYFDAPPQYSPSSPPLYCSLSLAKRFSFSSHEPSQHTDAPTPILVHAECTAQTHLSFPPHLSHCVAQLLAAAHKLEHNQTRTHFLHFPNWSLPSLLITSLQTGFNLRGRNNIPAYCVKLNDLMKSAGELVEGNTAPLVLCSATQRRFLEVTLLHSENTCCCLFVRSESMRTDSQSAAINLHCVREGLRACTGRGRVRSRRTRSHSQTTS